MRLLFLFKLIFLLSSCSPSSVVCENASVEGFTHYNYDHLTIFKDTSGDTLKIIGPDEEAGWITLIKGTSEKYFKVDLVDLNITNVWIDKGSVSLNTRNYNNEDITLYKEPITSSKKSGVLVVEQTVKILNVCNQWALVLGIDKDNKLVEGWLKPEMQCGSPYTTFP